MSRRKTKLINFRTTERDYERIKRLAERSGRSVTEYVTAMALDGKIVIVPGWRETAFELNKIGVNLNQLTRLCHEGVITCLELDATKDEVAKLWRLLNSQTQAKD